LAQAFGVIDEIPKTSFIQEARNAKFA